MILGYGYWGIGEWWGFFFPFFIGDNSYLYRLTAVMNTGDKYYRYKKRGWYPYQPLQL
jgi:hypothetical protein